MVTRRALRCTWRLDAPVAVMLACTLLPAGTAGAGQLDSSDFYKIRRGMSESELLIRAGQPDIVTYPGVSARERTIGGTTTDDQGNTSFTRFRRTDIPEIKQYHYVPDKGEHDPFLTVITLRGGLISRIDRTKVFSREHLPEVPSSGQPSRTAPSDTDIRRERVERTLKAAQDYAETRSRLLEQRAASPGVEQGSIYRGQQQDGSYYYGDRPAREEPAGIGEQ